MTAPRPMTGMPVTLTETQLREVLKTIAPGLSLNLYTEEPGDGFYVIQLGVKFDSRFRLSPHELADPNIAIRYLSDEAEQLVKGASAALGLDKKIAEAVAQRDVRWKQQIAPILMAAGIAPTTVQEIINNIKENVK